MLKTNRTYSRTLGQRSILAKRDPFLLKNVKIKFALFSQKEETFNSPTQYRSRICPEYVGLERF